MVQAETDRRIVLAENILNGEKGKPRGDGHPVMPVPGLLKSDEDMRGMRDWLSEEGYMPIKSGIRKNREPGPHILGMISRLESVVRETGQKATLIGVSLGGIYSIVVGVMRPDLVQRVVLIGTATTRHVRDAANRRYRKIIDMVIGGNPSYESFLHAVPTTSIPAEVELFSFFTRKDKVFNWRCCVDPRARQNIEVLDSHYELHKSPEVFRIINGVLPKVA